MKSFGKSYEEWLSILLENHLLLELIPYNIQRGIKDVSSSFIIDVQV